MKKVIGIFLTMVMVFVFIAMAVAENPAGDFTVSEIQKMVDDWIHCQEREEYYGSYNFKDGIYYSKGIISERYFEEVYGNTFSIEAMKNLYLNNDKYGGNWDIKECEIKLAGFIEGYDVYTLNMKSENVPLGECDNTDYYQISIVFMVHNDV